MQDFIKKGLSLGIGLAAYSKEQLEKIVDELVKRGEVPIEESKELVKDLIDRGEQEKSELKAYLQAQFQEALADLDIADKEQIKSLENRIFALEQRVKELEGKIAENQKEV